LDGMISLFHASFLVAAVLGAPSAVTSTTSLPSTTTELVFVTDAPWDLNYTVVPDALSTALQVETLMPWWMLPVSSGVTGVGQYVVLGFDLAFNPRKHSTSGWLLKACTTGPLVVLALNGWRVDAMRLWSVVGGSLFQRMSIRLLMLLTSSNFIKAMTLWGSFIIQSPVAALGLRPQYAAFPGLTGFPYSPFGARWLHPMKWLLGIVLLPYLMPIIFVKSLPICGAFAAIIAEVVIWCWWAIRWIITCGPCRACWARIMWIVTCGPCRACWARIMWLLHCGLCIAMKPICCFFWSTFFMLITLGLLPYPRHCFEYWFWVVGNLGLTWPVWGLLLLQAWAYICPYIFTLIYSIATCAKFEETKKGFSEVEDLPGGDLGSALLGEEPTHRQRMQQLGRRMSEMALGDAESRKCHKWCQWLMMMPEPIKFPSHVKSALSDFDSDAYGHDFGTSSSSQEATPQRFKAEKIAIVLATLNFQVQLLMFQVFMVLIIRYIFLSINLGGFHGFDASEEGANQQTQMAAAQEGLYDLFKRTLLERSFASYTGTLEGKFHQGMNSTELYVNTFWGML